MVRLVHVIVLLLLLAPPVVAAQSPPPSETDRSMDAFYGRWVRADGPVAWGPVRRTWLWGRRPISRPLYEAYAQAPGGWRVVQYFDKARMEIIGGWRTRMAYFENDPNFYDPAAWGHWYVTHGQLATELVTGELQIGEASFEAREPAQIPVAGDPDGPAPTYATFRRLRDAAPLAFRAPIIQRLDRDGLVSRDPALERHGVTVASSHPATRHTVASVFWEFMHASGLVAQLHGPGGRTWPPREYVEDRLFPDPFEAVGFPLTEAYWTTAPVGGVPKEVLVQVFQRRVLTYTPDNPEGWRVEAGNVGQHYYQWRYGPGATPRQTAPADFPSPPDRPSQYRLVATWPLSSQADIYSGIGTDAWNHVYLIHTRWEPSQRTDKEPPVLSRLERLGPDGTLLDWHDLRDGAVNAIGHRFDVVSDRQPGEATVAVMVTVGAYRSGEEVRFVQFSREAPREHRRVVIPADHRALSALAIDRDQNIYLSISATRLHKYDRTGTFLGRADPPAQPAWGAGYGIDTDARGNIAIIARVEEDSPRGLIFFNRDGNYAGQWRRADVRMGPTDVTFDEATTAYITDPPGNRIVMVHPGSMTSSTWGEDVLKWPSSVAVAPTGTVYVRDADGIKKFEPVR